MGYGYELGNDESLPRLRLGDCWIEGCLRDAYQRVTFRNTTTGGQATGLLCDEHAQEAHDGTD